MTTAALAPAEAAGLVVLDDTGLRFRRPLVRAAVASGELTSVRRAAHSALAAAYANDGRSQR